MIKHIEVIVTSSEEAVLAEQYGATRLELIHDFDLGGLSPRPELVKEVCESVNVPVNVMVRPHGESFLFDGKDMLMVIKEIDYIAENTKANAIVFGTLMHDGSINFHQLESILKYIENTSLELTFHRAIDASNDVVANCNKLLSQYHQSKLNRILSSGGYDKAIEGVGKLVQMQKMCDEYGVNLLVGSGVSPSNASTLIQQIGCTEIHIGTGVRVSGILNEALFKSLFDAIH